MLPEPVSVPVFPVLLCRTAGYFFKGFIKKTIVGIAHQFADLSDGKVRAGEQLAGFVNSDMLKIFHHTGAGSLPEQT